jgi:glycosyltransferase involved in cell wall biosynthesis
VFGGDVSLDAHVERATHVATRILPRVRRTFAHAELIVVATAPTAAARRLSALDGVRVLAPVADVRPSLWSASVCVVPAAGAHSLMLPAMALGTPVVAAASAIGTLADGVIAGQHLQVAETDDRMVEAITLVLRRPIETSTLARNARALVERRYTWKAVAAAHETVFARVAGRLARPQLGLAA